MNNVVTIKDIAKKTGVSETTVSLSFQEGSRISSSTRKKVLKVAQELNYVRNTVAQNLRGGRTHTLGFIVNDINDSFYNTMSRIASNIANQRGFQLIYAETNWSPEKAIEVTKTMIAKRVEGILLSLCEKETVSLDLIEHTNTPYIVVDTVPDFYRGPYVINNEITMGQIAGGHLISQGCKRVAFFNAAKHMSDFSAFRLQLRGLKMVLENANIPFGEEDIFYAGITIKEGAEAFKNLVGKGIEYDGILCVNDYVAYGVMEEAEKKSLTIGKDIALIGIDNLEYSGLRRISLTSVNIDYEKMTSIAMTELIDMIENGRCSSVRQIIEPTLVIRDSSKLAKHV